MLNLQHEELVDDVVSFINERNFRGDECEILSLASPLGKWDLKRRIGERAEYDFRITTADKSEERVEFSKQKGIADEYVVARAENLHFPEGRFDYSWAARLLPFLEREERRKSLEEMVRVTHPNGRIAIQEHPHIRMDFYSSQELEEHIEDFYSEKNSLENMEGLELLTQKFKGYKERLEKADLGPEEEVMASIYLEKREEELKDKYKKLRKSKEEINSELDHDLEMVEKLIDGHFLPASEEREESPNHKYKEVVLLLKEVSKLEEEGIETTRTNLREQTSINQSKVSELAEYAEGEELVEISEVRKGRGRPKKLTHLTPKGKEFLEREGHKSRDEIKPGEGEVYFSLVEEFGDELDYSEETKEKATELIGKVKGELSRVGKSESIAGGTLYLAQYLAEDPQVKSQKDIAEVAGLSQTILSYWCNKLSKEYDINTRSLVRKKAREKREEKAGPDEENIVDRYPIDEISIDEIKQEIPKRASYKGLYYALNDLVDEELSIEEFDEALRSMKRSNLLKGNRATGYSQVE